MGLEFKILCENLLGSYWVFLNNQIYLTLRMVSSVAFHPAGTIIASASTDRTIKLFDIRTHKLIQHYGDAHAQVSTSTDNAIGGVNTISFGGLSGEWLISTGMDGVVKVISIIDKLDLGFKRRSYILYSTWT